jgi:hypothetical protein
LLTEPNLPTEIEAYLLRRNVTIHRLQFVNCTTKLIDTDIDEIKNSHDREVVTCVEPYAHIKIRWSRFPIFRDLLVNCTECSGPVLVSDVRDTFFQRDPFSPTQDGTIPVVNGLHLFEEHRLTDTNDRIVHKAVSLCYGDDFAAAKIDNHPMLCSGTTVGTRQAMILYLESMYHEMMQWIQNPSCRFNTNGDDQAIHNLLYYTGQFQDKIGTPLNLPIETFGPRAGLVNTVGVIGKRIWEMHKKDRAMRNIVKLPQLRLTHYTGDFVNYTDSDPNNPNETISTRWLGLHYDLTDATGRFINYDGSYSPVVHQYDRFNFPVQDWMDYVEGTLYT